MASSNNTTWLKGFSGSPKGVAYGEMSEADLIRETGREIVFHPLNGEDAVPMTRWEALARTLWTRGVIDGDMTAMKLLYEMVHGQNTGPEVAGTISADDLAAAEALLRASYAELDVDEEH